MVNVGKYTSPMDPMGSMGIIHAHLWTEKNTTSTLFHRRCPGPPTRRCAFKSTGVPTSSSFFNVGLKLLLFCILHSTMTVNCFKKGPEYMRKVYNPKLYY